MHCLYHHMLLLYKTVPQVIFFFSSCCHSILQLLSSQIRPKIYVMEFRRERYPNIFSKNGTEKAGIEKGQYTGSWPGQN